MTYQEIVQSREHLEKLKKHDLSKLPVLDRRSFYELCLAFQKEVDFYSDCQKRLAEKYGTVKYDGTIEFEGGSPEARLASAQPYLVEMQALNCASLPKDLPYCFIDASVICDVPTDVMVALSGIVEFFRDEVTTDG